MDQSVGPSYSFQTHIAQSEPSSDEIGFGNDDSISTDDNSWSFDSRSDLDNDELIFSDHDLDASTIEDLKDNIPSTVTLEDVDHMKQTQTYPPSLSSMAHMNLKAAERRDYEDKRELRIRNISPRSHVNENWVGIPPLHHQKNLTVRENCSSAISFSRYGRHSFEPIASSLLDGREHYKRMLQSRRWATTQWSLRKAEQAWNRMPPHLVPFVPYIEKSMDGVSNSIRLSKSEYIDGAVIRKWLHTCEKLHGTRCSGDGQSVSDQDLQTRPLWLIDVSNGCIVSASQNARYVALSYVWGGDGASACTTKANMEDLQKEEGLYNEAWPLPCTILDAIHLVIIIGERYLWVDRFCIVQDEYTTKQSQLNSMGNIYAGAVFTLVAAQNNEAALGLYEKRKVMPNPPPPSDNDIKTSSLTDRQVLLDQAMRLMKTKWFSRGWTFQEYLFSKRRVVIHNDTVNWECLCAAWHEAQDMTALSSVPQVAQLKNGMLLSSPKAHLTGFEVTHWPDMSRYARLVSMFNRRDLAYPEDVLDAFAGVLSHLSRTFPGGFISGVPQMCFDAALLWQPWSYMNRRSSKRHAPSIAILPSWSWAGWAGDVNSESWRSAANYLLEKDNEDFPDQQCSWKTVSTVKWSYSEALDSERIDILVPPQFATPTFDSINNSLPIGWSSKPSSDRSEDMVYHHTCDPSQSFRYPIPVNNLSGPYPLPVNARFLHVTTSRSYLKLGPTYRTTASDCSAVELVTENGKWAGVLRLNCSPLELEDTMKLYLNVNEGRCELIEVSEGSVENQEIEAKSFDEWNRPGCPRRNGVYKFVNVLWIEWVGGTVYRKALGRVEEKIWREAAKEKIDVTLG